MLFGKIGRCISKKFALNRNIRKPYSVALPVMTLVADVSAFEGDNGTTLFIFTVQKTGLLTQSSSATYTVASVGVNGASNTDFPNDIFPTGTVNFPIGSSIQYISIAVKGDTNVEAIETFALTLSNPIYATLLVSTRVGTINNDDGGTTTLRAAIFHDGDSMSFDYTGFYTGAFKAAHPEYVYENLAVSGSGLNDLENRKSIIIAAKPYLTSFLIGGNDISSNPVEFAADWADDTAMANHYADRIAAFATSLHTALPGTKVIWGTPFPIDTTATVASTRHNIRRPIIIQRLRDMATAGIIDYLVDYTTIAAMNTVAGMTNTTVWNTDHLHPTELNGQGTGGHDLIYAVYNPRMLEIINSVSAPAGTPIGYDIVLLASDSYGVGIIARETQDIDWPNVYQYRASNNTIDPDISPIEQGIAPDGTNYLSAIEYFGKSYVRRTGRKLLIVGYGWNGTRLMLPGQGWDVNGSLHTAAIAKVNAAIVKAKAQYASSKFVGIVQWILANDANVDINSIPTVAAIKTVLNATHADYRAQITDATNCWIVQGGLLAEYIAGVPAVKNRCERALQQVAAEGTNVKYVPIPPGFDAGDFLHPNNAGERYMGTAFDNILSNTTNPVITSPTGTGNSLAGGSTLNKPLTADKFVTWSLSGADAGLFEILFNQNANEVVATNTLRWLNNTTRAYGSPADANGDNVYELNIIARDGSGNVTTKPYNNTISAPYGVGNNGPITLNRVGEYQIAGNYGGSVPGVVYTAGLNFVYVLGGGGASDFTTVTLDGVTLDRINNNGNAYGAMFYGVMTQSAIGPLVVGQTSYMQPLNIRHFYMTGTKATITDYQDYNTGYVNPQLVSKSYTIPNAGDMIVGVVRGPAPLSAQAGVTTVYNYSTDEVLAKRTTTGTIGYDCTAGYEQIFSFLIEKSV